MRLDLELVQDGAVIEAMVPGFGFGSGITPGCLVGVRWSQAQEAHPRRSGKLN
jgi:hypothetical protein